jgi:hypothetical protein
MRAVGSHPPHVDGLTGTRRWILGMLELWSLVSPPAASASMVVRSPGRRLNQVKYDAFSLKRAGLRLSRKARDFDR